MRKFLAVALTALLFQSAADAQPVRKVLGKLRSATQNAVCAVTGNCSSATGFWAPSGMASPAAFVPVPVEAPKPMVAQAQVVGAPGGRIIGLVKKLQIVRGRIINGLVERGVDRGEAERVVGQLGDGTLLKLLLEHLDDIVAIILKLLPLFTDDGKVSFLFVDPHLAQVIVSDWFGFYVSGCPV